MWSYVYKLKSIYIAYIRNCGCNSDTQTDAPSNNTPHLLRVVADVTFTCKINATREKLQTKQTHKTYKSSLSKCWLTRGYTRQNMKGKRVHLKHKGEKETKEVAAQGNNKSKQMKFAQNTQNKLSEENGTEGTIKKSAHQLTSASRMQN